MNTKGIHYMEMIFIGIIIIWLIILSFFSFRTIIHFNRLSSISKGSLNDVLNEIIKSLDVEEKEIEKIHTQIENIQKDSLFHIQKIGIVRFNPFADTGGSQSFTLTLVDGNNSGLVMTSLYARTGNRWYIKKVKNGKGVEIDLSKEELHAIAQAKHIT